MTAVDGDGIDEDLTRAVSVAMLAAARAGEQIARMTQAAAREREARADGNTSEAQRQLAAHTESAKAYFEVVTRPEYLSVATDEQIREVARQAQAWQERLPEAQRATEAASRELGERTRGHVDERPVVLAADGEAADRWARESGTGSEPDREPTVEPKTAVHETSNSSIGRKARAIADVAQARPAREAPAAGRGGAQPRSGRSATQTRQAGLER